MNKKVLVLLAIALLISGIPTVVYLVRQRQEIQKKAVVGNKRTVLSLDPATGDFQVDQSFPVKISFATQGALVNTIQVVLDVSGAQVDRLQTRQVEGLDWRINQVVKTAQGHQVQLLLSASLKKKTYHNSAPVVLAVLHLKAAQPGDVQLVFDKRLSKVLNAGVDVLLTPHDGTYGVTAIPTRAPTAEPATPTAVPTVVHSSPQPPKLSPSLPPTVPMTHKLSPVNHRRQY